MNETNGPNILDDMKRLISLNSLIASQLVEEFKNIESVRVITIMTSQDGPAPLSASRAPEVTLLADVLVSALEVSPVVIIEIIKDAPDDPLILWAGRMLEELMGYFPGELRYKPLSVLVPDSKKDAHRLFTREFQKSPTNRIIGDGMDLFGQRKDGTLVPVRVHLMNFGCQGRLFTSATVMFLDPQDCVPSKA